VGFWNRNDHFLGKDRPVTTQTDRRPAASRTRNGWLRLRQIALTLLAIPVALLALGASYEALMAAGDAQRYPPPGRLVDIGGRRLHLHCVGGGSPTIVFESGHAGTSIDWTLVQQQLAGEARVCAYERAGLGWSDPGPLPRNPERIVADLHALLTAAGEPAPYLLVGHSLGGRYVRLFAETYPQDVAGIVLVDARSEHHDQALSAEAHASLEANNEPGAAMDWMRRLGVMRLVGGRLVTSQIAELKLLPPELVQTSIVLGMRPESVTTSGSEFAERERSDDLLEKASLDDMPLWVLASQQSSAMDPSWLEGQRQQAALSTSSVFQTLDGGHYLQLGNATNVSTAIREVMQLASR
jgi:pimeloyl-ACP methyl ester carboxylesterase